MTASELTPSEDTASETTASEPTAAETTAPEAGESADGSFLDRLVKVGVSIVVLVPVTVFLGYGGWLVLTVTAALGGPDPETDGGELLRHRLAAWPDRNREVMRTNGRAELPLRP